jgi:very-short-patch-repair endonuclease
VIPNRSTGIAKGLRRQLTNAERKLWYRVRDRRLDGWKFRRQVPVECYIADFLCADARLIIELDGGQHAVRAAEDARRTEVLQAAGYLVLRFWNNDVLQNIDGVLEEIVATLSPTPLTLTLSPTGRGDRAELAELIAFKL